MLYKYEMHVHDSLCSRRGHNPPEVIAKVYYDRGYARHVLYKSLFAGQHRP